MTVIAKIDILILGTTGSELMVTILPTIVSIRRSIVLVGIDLGHRNWCITFPATSGG